MTVHELKQIRLYRQHLTDQADKITVVKDLNGLQAQFTVNAFHALKIRCNEEITPESYGDGLVKNWTVRGTVHVFAKDDLPLFIYDKEKYRSENFGGYGIFSDEAYRYAEQKGCPDELLKQYRESGTAWTLSPEQQREWSRFILQKIGEGVTLREELKAACKEHGMTAMQSDDMFHPWGGGIRDLCERGFLNHVVQEKKAFELAPPFEPMGKDAAELEMARRYFLHYAPATVNDAAYYFGWNKTKVKEIMQKLPLECIEVEGREYFYMGELPADCPDIPRVIFLAGFDQLMLGYKKEESIFLPPEHLRGIFNLAGIVMPSILLNGKVIGKWRRKGKKLTLELFERIGVRDRKYIERAACEEFGDSKIEVIGE